MRLLQTIIIAAGIIFLLTGCSNNAGDESVKPSIEQNDTKGGYVDMKQDEAKRNLDKDKGIVLLDVRTTQEYAEVHIPGSILIPLDTLQAEAEKKLTDKSATIYVYCRSGNRSTTASKLLVELGYKNVFNIGGISTWPYETEKGSK